MEFLSTKGIEYLMVIAYLLLLVPFWWLLVGRAPARAMAPAGRGGAGEGRRGWFEVPEGLLFHRGHTWVREVAREEAPAGEAGSRGGGLFRVGLDDFARRLLGKPDALLLPPPGGRLEQGEPGWRLALDGREVEMLSPVGGEVAEVNREVLAAPELVADDPYGRGWLLTVRAPRPEAARSNLLPGGLARRWTEEASRRLSAMMTPELGAVLQDGGVPVSGFARELDPERWPEIAAELLLTAGSRPAADSH